MKRSDILNTRPTFVKLCELAVDLGYKDQFHQLINAGGKSCVGDLICLLEDNPGAIEALIEWCAKNLGEENREQVEEEDPG